MAVGHYCVSTHSGNDANSGTSPDHAWATIDHAASQDYSGNLDGTDIHLAPGTYRETVVVDYAGAASRVVRFIGDPEGRWFPNDQPGRVRITGANAADVPQNVTVITSAKDYVEWHRLSVDGGATGLAFAAVGTGRRAYDCMASAKSYAFDYGSRLERCYGIAGTYAFDRSAVAANCVGSGGGSAFYWVTSVLNCVGFGGNFGFRNCASYNCLAIAMATGYRDCTGANCFAAWCASDVYAGNSAPTNSYAISVPTLNLFSQGKQFCLPWAALSRDLLPWLALNATGGLLRQGSNAVPGFLATDVDISGHRLRLKGSAIDIGPWSVSEPSDAPPSSGLLDWTTYHSAAPSIRLVAEGDVLLQVPAQGNQPATVTVWVRHDGITGSKPQIVLRGESITEQTGTAAAGDGQWERLLVTATPSSDEVLTLVLRARNSAGTCRFSDLVVSA